MRESDFEIFETVGALVVVFERDGRIVYWNRRCSDLTGYSLEEVRGRKLWDFALVSEEVEPVKAVFSALLASGPPSPYANHWLTRAGERRWIAWSLTSAAGPSGRSQYIIKTGIDRTESKEALDGLRASAARLDASAAETVRLYEAARQAAEDLREANQHMVTATIRAQEMTEMVEAALVRSEDSARELRAVAELRERFLGIVGHDLRNPLGAITMTADTLLHRGKLDERDQRAVSRIASSTAAHVPHDPPAARFYPRPAGRRVPPRRQAQRPPRGVQERRRRARADRSSGGRAGANRNGTRRNAQCALALRCRAAMGTRRRSRRAVARRR